MIEFSAMKIESTYQKILEELNKGHRGLVRLTEEDELQLIESLRREEQLLEVLCILEHSSTPSLRFGPILIHLLNGPIDDALLIFTLNCARRHIVEARFQRGLRLEYDFLETLKKLLFHKNPEVVEWTLRLIEGCGNHGIYFSREFAKIKPPPWKWFNAHQRAIREIIALLENRWSVFEKSRPGS
jgi:hypothetical protein